MKVTKELVEALAKGVAPARLTAELPGRIEHVVAVAESVRRLHAELADEEKRHQAEVAKVKQKLAKVRATCPHPIPTTYRGTAYDSPTVRCDVCGYENDMSLGGYDG